MDPLEVDPRALAAFAGVSGSPEATHEANQEAVQVTSADVHGFFP